MKRQTAFVLGGFVLTAILLELAGSLALKTFPALEKSRAILQGKMRSETDVNATPQAYLLYIPTPLFESNNQVQNNADGYRGPAIPLERSPGTFRILFMGGSTTYGEGVENPGDSYPAQLGRLLAGAPELAGKNIEVINAGLRWGTSAEILTHYLLKFRYYKPDLVVLNPGGNDPQAYIARSYQPDYSSFRMPPPAIKPLQPQARWLLHSRFFSAMIVLLFFPDLATGALFVHNGENTPAEWFHSREPGVLQLDELAFYNNITTVVREIKAGGAEAFLLSYQGNPYDAGTQLEWRAYFDYEEQVLQTIGKEQGVPFSPFPLAVMSNDVWVDASHINAEGEKHKAAYVYDKLRPYLATWGKHTHNPDAKATKLPPLVLHYRH